MITNGLSNAELASKKSNERRRRSGRKSSDSVPHINDIHAKVQRRKSAQTAEEVRAHVLHISTVGADLFQQHLDLSDDVLERKENKLEHPLSPLARKLSQGGEEGTLQDKPLESPDVIKTTSLIRTRSDSTNITSSLKPRFGMAARRPRSLSRNFSVNDVQQLASSRKASKSKLHERISRIRRATTSVNDDAIERTRKSAMFAHQILEELKENDSGGHAAIIYAISL
jgi:hypothetical protein